MEAKRKQKAWRGRGGKTTWTWWKPRVPAWHVSSQRPVPGGFRPQLTYWRKADAWATRTSGKQASASTAIFSLPVSKQQRTNSKSVTVIWVFPRLSVASGGPQWCQRENKGCLPQSKMDFESGYRWPQNVRLTWQNSNKQAGTNWPVQSVHLQWILTGHRHIDATPLW